MRITYRHAKASGMVSAVERAWRAENDNRSHKSQEAEITRWKEGQTKLSVSEDALGAEMIQNCSDVAFSPYVEPDWLALYGGAEVYRP